MHLFDRRPRAEQGGEGGANQPLKSARRVHLGNEHFVFQAVAEWLHSNIPTEGVLRVEEATYIVAVVRVFVKLAQLG